MKYFLDRTITIRRLKELATDRDVFSATGTAGGYPAGQQEPSPEILQHYEGQTGNLYNFFVDYSCPVRDGDQIICRDVLYDVQDVKEMDFIGGAVQFKRVIVSKGDVA